MLPLSANSDYKNKDTFSVQHEYYDWDGTFQEKELFGEDVLNQSIEMVLTTEPNERLFNLGFGTPLFTMLFENPSRAKSLADSVFDIIEFWVPISINRAGTNVKVDPDTNSIEFRIPYKSNNGLIVGYFARRISR